MSTVPETQHTTIPEPDSPSHPCTHAPPRRRLKLVQLRRYCEWSLDRLTDEASITPCPDLEAAIDELGLALVLVESASERLQGVQL
jgi:hypothetical protein